MVCDGMNFEELLGTALRRASEEEYRELKSLEEGGDMPVLGAGSGAAIKKLMCDREILSGTEGVCGVKEHGACDMRPVSRLAGRKRRRVLFVAAALVIMCAGTAVAVEPVRERIAEAFITVFGDHADISTTKEGHGDEKFTFRRYEPDAIPEGYRVILDECCEETASSDIVYENGTGNTIAISQVASDKISMDLASDGETLEKLCVRGIRGYYVTDKEIGSIVWEEDGCVFTISSQLNREELVNLAERLKPVE